MITASVMKGLNSQHPLDTWNDYEERSHAFLVEASRTFLLLKYNFYFNFLKLILSNLFQFLNKTFNSPSSNFWYLFTFIDDGNSPVFSPTIF